MVVGARQGARPAGKRRIGRAAGQWFGDEALPLYYRLLRWTGLVGAPAQGTASVAPVVSLPPPAAAKLKSSSPILSNLQKRAAWELFDWLGLDMVPIDYWRIL